MLSHQSAKLLAVDDYALVAKRRPHTAIAVALEFVADRTDPDDNVARRERNQRSVIEGGAWQAHQLASPADGDATGPVTTEMVALLGRGACFKAPFNSSISSACRPTIRSRAAIFASYSWIRSAACTSSSRAPASNLPTQIRINCREMSCRFESACSVSPAMNSSATCRLKAALWDRCFVMASILRKPSSTGQFQSLFLSIPRGALHWSGTRGIRSRPATSTPPMPYCSPRPMRWRGG